MSLVKAYYADFGPTLATEKLKEKHACFVSRETLRKWMIEDGLWIDRKHRLPPVHQPRNRRERAGELVQIDGSRHYWFENRGPESTLIAYIDDATSRIQHAAFVASESTQNPSWLTGGETPLHISYERALQPVTGIGTVTTS
jgi:hypothetical protein